MGGPDAEREVSIDSGTSVATALQKNTSFETSLVLIDEPSIDDILKLEANVIFPVLHGPYGEGGPLQKLLEQTSIPFVGSTSTAAAAAMDKVRSKEIASSIGIQTPSWQVRNEPSCSMKPPVVLKPIADGSSVDISICTKAEDVEKVATKLLRKREWFLAEEYKKGRELTVGILGDSTLPPIEIIPQGGNYDFAAKYERDDTSYIIEPTLPNQLCTTWAKKIVHRLNIRDIARVDFILDDAGLWFLEVNTMPGFTDHSLLPMSAAHVGLNMTSLCTKLVEYALARKKRTP
jgi:D-alanine-D-alanine ligase